MEKAMPVRDKVFLGIDVGTGSARTGAFDRNGKLIAKAEKPIKIWKPRPGFVEQSSEDIWKATAKAIRQCLLSGGIRAEKVKVSPLMPPARWWHWVRVLSL